MQKTRAKTIKGLSIASIILSGLGLLALIVLGIICAAVSDNIDVIVGSVNNGMASGAYDSIYDYRGYSYDYLSPFYYDYDYIDYNDQQLLYLLLQMGIYVVIIGFIMEVVVLVASIIMLVNCDKPQKLGLVFGWGLAGAIVSLLSGSFVQTVLLVIAIVFVYKDRQLYRTGQYPIANAVQNVPMSANPTYPPQPVQVAQPAQPVQPVQSVQPTQPQQPIQPAQPVQPQPQQQAPTELQVTEVDAVVIESEDDPKDASGGNLQ